MNSFNLSGSGNQNCPNADQITGLKAMMVEKSFQSSYFLCAAKWANHPGLNQFRNQNQNLFVNSNGQAVTGAVPTAHAYGTFIINRIHRELPQTQEFSESYIQSVYGNIGNSRSPGFQAMETIGTSMLGATANIGIENGRVVPGAQAAHCSSVAEQLLVMLNTDGPQDLLTEIRGFSSANDPEFWEASLASIRSEKGLGACEIPIE